MSYRPQVKADNNGTTQDLPIDAETVQGKTPVFTTTNQTISGVKTYNGNQIYKGYLDIRGTAAEKHLKTRGIGGSDGNGNESDLYLQYNSEYSTKFGKSGNGSLNSNGTITEAGTLLSNKYSPIGHSHESVLDYGDTNKTIKIGYSGSGLTANQILYIAGYTAGADDNEHKIKDISKDVLKSWLGYTEVSSGIISNGGTLTATSGYVWIVYPYDYTANTFTFSYGSGYRTAYDFAIVQGGGCIRYFQSTTQLTRYYVSSITFSTQMAYIKFKI